MMELEEREELAKAIKDIGKALGQRDYRKEIWMQAFMLASGNKDKLEFVIKYANLAVAEFDKAFPS